MPLIDQVRQCSSLLGFHPRVEAWQRQPARVLMADSLEEAVQLLELARASLANSHADRDLIVAEDLEEDPAAAVAAAAAAAAEEMAMATRSTTLTARPGTRPATDVFLSKPPGLPLRRRRQCKSSHAMMARRAGKCGARR